MLIGTVVLDCGENISIKNFNSIYYWATFLLSETCQGVSSLYNDNYGYYL